MNGNQEGNEYSYDKYEPFMRVKKLVPNAIVPQRAHSNDAGLDVFTMENGCIHAGKDGVVRTGISMAMPDGWVAVVKEKSGRATKNKLTIGACVIDSGYRGELLIHIFNNDQSIPFTYGMGEKIAQLVIVPCWTGEPTLVDDLDMTERGEGKFGSSGINENRTCSAISHEGTIGGLQAGLGPGELSFFLAKGRSGRDTVPSISCHDCGDQRLVGSDPPKPCPACSGMDDLREINQAVTDKLDELGMRGELAPNSWDEDGRIEGSEKIHERFEDGQKEFLKRQWESLEGKQTGEMPLKPKRKLETRDDW